MIFLPGNGAVDIVKTKVGSLCCHPLRLLGASVEAAAGGRRPLAGAQHLQQAAPGGAVQEKHGEDHPQLRPRI